MADTPETGAGSSSLALESLQGLSAEGRSHLAPAMNAWEFLGVLRREEMLEDSVRVLAHILPRAYGVAWACECWQEARQGAEPNPADKAAIAAARRWLNDPSEDNRRAALELADRLGYESPAAWLAAAAGWSGGSMLAPDLPPVSPPAGLSGQAVMAAVMLAAAEDPPGYTPRLASFVDRALAEFSPGAQ